MTSGILNPYILGSSETAGEIHRELILSLAPTGYWPCDDASGQMTDDSGNALHSASVAGSPAYSVKGPFGDAIGLNSGYFNMPAGLNITSASHWAFLATLRMEDVIGNAADRMLLGKNPPGDSGLGIYSSNTTGDMRIYRANTWITITTGWAGLYDAAWHTILWYWDGTNLKTYIDGSLFNTTAFGTFTARTAPHFGTYDSRSSSIWRGAIQHVAWFTGTAADNAAAAVVDLADGTDTNPYLGWNVVEGYDLTYLDSQAPTTVRYVAGDTGTYNLAGFSDTWDGITFSRHFLARFDLSAIPSVSQARLRLARTITITPTAGSTGLQVRQMLREYVASQATWNEWSTGNSWTLAGARSNGNDRGATVVGSVPMPTLFSPYEIDVTSLVTGGQVNKLMASYLTLNNGLVVYGKGGMSFQRPALIVR